MNEQMTALFAEKKAPQHCCRSTVHEKGKAVGELAALIQRQIAEYRMRLFAAELQDDLPEVFRGKMESMDQALKAAERIQAELATAIRNASSVMGQIDSVWADAEREIIVWHEARSREESRQVTEEVVL